jgi:hypothetical protein
VEGEEENGRQLIIIREANSSRRGGRMMMR